MRKRHDTLSGYIARNGKLITFGKAGCLLGQHARRSTCAEIEKDFLYIFIFIHLLFFLLWKRIGYPILVFRWEGQRANFQRVSWYSKKRMNELLPTGWWWRESLRLPVRQCPTPRRHWRLHNIRRPRRENNDEINEKGEKGKGEITQATSWIWFPNLASLPRAANRAALHVLFVSRTSSSSSSLPPVLSIDVHAPRTYK